MVQYILKAKYDRVVELLNNVVANEVCMSNPTKVIAYLISLGFTDDELINLVNFSPDDIIKAKNDTIDDSDSDIDSYESDYPDLEPEDDRYTSYDYDKL